MLQALNEMKTAKASGPSDVSLELIAASGGVGIQVMAKRCLRILDRFGLPVEWALIWFQFSRGRVTPGTAAAMDL